MGQQVFFEHEIKRGDKVKVIGHRGVTSHGDNVMPIGTICDVSTFKRAICPNTGTAWSVCGIHLFELEDK